MVLNFDVCDHVPTKPALAENGGVLGDRCFDQELMQTGRERAIARWG